MSSSDSISSPTPNASEDSIKPVDDDDEFFDAVQKGNITTSRLKSVKLIFISSKLQSNVYNSILGLYLRVLDMVKDQNINAIDKNGFSALSYAAKYGELNIKNL